MRPLAILTLLGAALACTPSGLVAQVETQVGAKIIPLGEWNHQIPTLEHIDYSWTIETPSRFGPLEGVQWAVLQVFRPSAYNEIVPIYSYSTDAVCPVDQVTVARAPGLALSVVADAVGRDVNPGALHVIRRDDPSGDTAGRLEFQWHPSLNDACNSTEGYSSIAMDSAFARSVNDILNEDVSGNEAYFTALPLWGVDTAGEHWALCQGFFTDSIDSECGMRLSAPAIPLDQRLPAETSQ